MQYKPEQAIEILERTPAVFKTLLSGLSEDWVMNNEGPDTFSPFDVIGHVIHGEKTDWATRAKIILEHGTEKPFTPWDRFAQYEESKGKSLETLLEDFAAVCAENIQWLKSLSLTKDVLEKKGQHPTLGEVTLRNLLST